MTAEKPVALFDLDDTLADFTGAMERDLADIGSTREDANMPETVRDRILHRRRRLIKRQLGWWENLPALEAGFNVLGITRELGFRHMILSKGPETYSQAWAEKVNWCRKHLPASLDYGITLSDDKSLVYGRVLVDDFPAYVEPWLKWRPRGLVVMVARPHNEGFEHPNAIRYDGSSASFRLLRQRLTEAFNRGAPSEKHGAVR